MEGSRFFKRKDYYKKHLPQQKATSHALALLGKLSQSNQAKKEVEFFFYTNTIKKAEQLVLLLKNQGYEVFKPSRTLDKIGVSGNTGPISLKEQDFLEWAEKMSDLGYACDCEFDGWGVGQELDEPFDPDSIF